MVPPQVGLTAPGVINKNSIAAYSLEGSCGDDGEDSVTVKVAGLIDKSADCVGGQWSLQLASSELGNIPEADGIAIVVEHRDGAGNVGRDDTGRVAKDTVLPVLKVTSGLTINSANENSYSIEGTCSESGRSMSITIGSGSAVSRPCNSEQWTFSPSVTAEGSVPVAITQMDSAGNTGTLDVTLLRDVTAPTVGFDSSLDINAANENAYHVSGTCSEEGAVTVSVEGIADSQQVNCNGSTWRTPPFDASSITSPDTDVVLSVTMVDSAGNPHGDTAVTKSVGKNTSNHAVIINRLPSPSTMAAPINEDNVGSYPVSGTCSNHVGDVTVTIGSASATGACSERSWSVTIAVPTSVADAAEVTITATFGTGSDQGTDSAKALQDVIAPQVAINTPLADETEGNLESYPLSGTCSFGDNPLTVAVGTAVSEGAVNCETGGTWSTTVDILPLGKGTFEVTASQTDALGNTGDDKESLIKTISNKRTFLLETVSLGGFHSCALKANGQVSCWGSGRTGQLGDGSGSNQNYPVTVEDNSNVAISDIVQISAGNYYSCALKSDGEVLCWGEGNIGQLGDNSTTSRNNPVSVVGEDSNDDGSGDGLLSGIVQISLGSGHTCALKSDGGVLCWGNNSFGQLGNGESGFGQRKSYPVKVQESNGTALSGVVQLSLGSDHTCAMTSGGEALCWGGGDLGKLGNGSESARVFATSVKVNSSTKLSGIVQVSGGSSHTCALKSNGEVWCWGDGDGKQVRNGDVINSEHFGSLYAIATIFDDGTLLGGVRQINVGDIHTCAQTSGMETKCWGGVGRLGNGASSSSYTPVTVIAGRGSSSPLAEIAQISVGGYHSCALISGGKIKCWGSGSSVPLGNGGTTNVYHPVTVIEDGTTSNIFKIGGTFQRSYSCVKSTGVCSLDGIVLAFASGTSSPSKDNDSPDIAISGVRTGETVKIYKDAACTQQVASDLTADGSLSDSGLSEGTYEYYYTVTDTNETSDCSQSFLAYVYDITAPDAPGVALGASVSSPGSDTTPAVKVSGIAPGDLVEVYIDSGCSSSAASAVRIDGISGEITVDALSVGTHTFYANATDAAGNVSGCSTTGVSYEVQSL